MEFVTEIEITELIKKIFPEVKEVPVSTSFTQSGLLSSLDLVSLVFELETEFDVTFDLEEVDLAEFDSPIRIAETINKKRGMDQLTIRTLIQMICEKNPEKEAVTFDETTYSYEELYNKIKTLAYGMMEDGITKGTHVVIVLDNRMEYILSYFALFYIGAIPIPINTRWNVEEAVRVIIDSESEYFITAKHQGKLIFEEIKERLNQSKYAIKQIYYCGEEIEDGKKFENLFSDKEVKLPELNGEDLAMISYTSGTTRMPKGVMLKHNSVTKISMYTAKVWTSKEDTPFSIAPLYSVQGFLSMLINLSVGSRFKMLSSFNTNDILEGTSVATMTRYDDSDEIRRNTVGRPIPGVEIKIVDESRNVVPQGEVGELAIRGYLMDGYYNNPEKTAEVIDEEGWLYTGDLARYYDSENISIVGRCKDMVIRDLLLKVKSKMYFFE